MFKQRQGEPPCQAYQPNIDMAHLPTAWALARVLPLYKKRSTLLMVSGHITSLGVVTKCIGEAPQCQVVLFGHAT